MTLPYHRENDYLWLARNAAEELLHMQAPEGLRMIGYRLQRLAEEYETWQRSESPRDGGLWSLTTSPSSSPNENP